MAEKMYSAFPRRSCSSGKLEALIAAEQDAVPTGWRMSPRSVLTLYYGRRVRQGRGHYTEIHGQPPPG